MNKARLWLCAGAHRHANPESSSCYLSHSLLLPGMAVSFYFILPTPKPQYPSDLPTSYPSYFLRNSQNLMLAEIKEILPQDTGFATQSLTGRGRDKFP
ncbi:hypothetical protein EVAR_98058_1 [Eumeta japonica]|uniref:Uncharacterized protein n=1 Tax=Eumeta variegata TaxID=151549 RepID=A0A4C1WFC0_EUMVA|nr:hypothetical protein EVAR_98058_1 [Eumeta japonica]